MMMEKPNRHNQALPQNSGLIIERLCKSYGDEIVLNNLSLRLDAHKTYCLMAPSGTGKTTLFRILLGLEQPDSGGIHGLSEKRLSAVFQEDRLLEGYTALENLRFVTGRQYTNETLTNMLRTLLPEDALGKPVHEFSGGMKRRTAILRALLAPSDMIIMDEPFTGLDVDTKLNVIQLIKERTEEKLLLLSTHNEEDAELLSAKIIHLSK